MMIIDTNVLLRYLLNDNEDLNKKAREIIDEYEIFVPYEVIVEATYILFKNYNIPRNEINSIMQQFIEMEDINFINKNTVQLAFKTYKNSNLDIVDCMLYAYNKNEEFDIKTFDKKLGKLLLNS